jgi:hypothetical protein
MALETEASLTQDMPYTNGAHERALVQLAGYEDVTATTTTQALRVDIYQTRITAAAVSSVATLPAGTFPGQRKVVTMPARAGSVTFILTPSVGVTWKQANGTDDSASVTFDAAGEYLVVLWDGAKWVNQSTNATVA